LLDNDGDYYSSHASDPVFLEFNWLTRLTFDTAHARLPVNVLLLLFLLMPTASVSFGKNS
jgi:hypothetical protein